MGRRACPRPPSASAWNAGPAEGESKPAAASAVKPNRP